ncbi:2,4-dienoyl-CoA reductase-like NADH-dependent reductase (Old Yellow Enzyme family) [Geodermatophilus bullaregiensis]|uniref:hypothetical protein n=1 Tax=Geodermatophilus bullaregiensis TaxID=1564160 RepID=UPI00195EE310|nr:hypothetical protein [Geodermatophilus bullaregiensis]MBM7806346.1 2,4-dienoyl-CoA reductase-like NADH-dependent reductase (Old Yellow Enzyme family) [Geodermatophilus bullaregiensis]
MTGPTPATPALLTPLAVRGVTRPNRLVVAPMCQYSATDGLVGDHHLVHLGRFGLGGSGLVLVEATAVTPEGRVSHGDSLGPWTGPEPVQVRAPQRTS